MKKKLVVWVDKQGLSIDKEVNFNFSDKSMSCAIKPLSTQFQTVRIEISKSISVKEYREGYIGKYKNELVDNAMRYIQIYALLNNITVVIKPSEFQSNEEEVYRNFELFCKHNQLDTLLKPSGVSTSFVYQNFQSSEVLPSISLVPNLPHYLFQVIDWYNTGLIQTQSANQFLHYFIPLEILTGRFIKKANASWKKEHREKHDEIYKLLNNILGKYDEKKFNSLQKYLSEYDFIEKLKKYFEDIFSTEERDKFWFDDSDVTENGKYPWGQYRKISQYGIKKEDADLFNVLRNLYKLRNSIVHEGRSEVRSEDIFVIENILRRVIKKELLKTKVEGDKCGI